VEIHHRGGGGETDGEVVRQGTNMRTEEDNAGVARSDGSIWLPGV
jgi:hypothetical protein